MSAWPEVQPRASRAATPMSTPPPKANASRRPTETPRAAQGHLRAEPPRRVGTDQAAEEHAEHLEDEPVVERRAALRGPR